MKLDKNVEEKWLKEVNEEKVKIAKEAYSKLDDLYELLRELTELKDLKFESVYKEEKNTFDFESENIAKRSHLLEIAWKEMVVTTFGVGVNAGKRIEDRDDYYYQGRPDIDTPVKGSGRVIINLHYHYQHISGGTNGAELGYAEYTNNDGWKITRTYKDYK